MLEPWQPHNLSQYYHPSLWRLYPSIPLVDTTASLPSCLTLLNYTLECIHPRYTTPTCHARVLIIISAYYIHSHRVSLSGRIRTVHQYLGRSYEKHRRVKLLCLIMVSRSQTKSRAEEKGVCIRLRETNLKLIQSIILGYQVQSTAFHFD